MACGRAGCCDYAVGAGARIQLDDTVLHSLRALVAEPDIANLTIKRQRVAFGIRPAARSCPPVLSTQVFQDFFATVTKTVYPAVRS